MKQKVVVIGFGYTGRLSIVRSVAQEGCDVILIALVPSRVITGEKRMECMPDAYSRYVTRHYICESKDEKGLIRILMDHCRVEGQKVILFPDNDFSALVIDKYRELLSDYFFIPGIRNEAGAVAYWMDKSRQKAMASQVGLNVVESWGITVTDGKFTIPDEIIYPCIVKPRSTVQGGKKMIQRCDNRQQLQERLDAVAQSHGHIDCLIERFVDIDTEYATLGFSDGSDVVIPGLLEFYRVAKGAHFGVAIQGKVFPVAGYEDLVDGFRRLVREIGFVGIFDVDFFRGDGKFYFCELNLRFGGSGYAFTKLGVNLPAMMVRYFRGEPYGDMRREVTGTAVYFNNRMAVDNWYEDLMPLKELKQIRRESDFDFVSDEIDTRPMRVWNRDYHLKQIKKRVKGWIGKK